MFSARQIWQRALNIILPPLCAGCRAPVSDPHLLCAACWQGLSFVAAPFCQRCGIPFEVEIDEALTCDACLSFSPAFDRARAPLVYDAASRPLILRLKHADQMHLAQTFAPLLRGAGAELLARADLLVPVPLARWRLWRRRYNQSAELARSLARLTGVPAALQAVKRVRATPSQGGLNREQRRKNVKKAFAVPDAALVRQKTIVLIDDVMTSGATAHECAQVLKAAGAARVDVLAVARVPLSG